MHKHIAQWRPGYSAELKKYLKQNARTRGILLNVEGKIKNDKNKF